METWTAENINDVILMHIIGNSETIKIVVRGTTAGQIISHP